MVHSSNVDGKLKSVTDEAVEAVTDEGALNIMLGRVQRRVKEANEQAQRLIRIRGTSHYDSDVPGASSRRPARGAGRGASARANAGG